MDNNTAKIDREIDNLKDVVPKELDENGDTLIDVEEQNKILRDRRLETKANRITTIEEAFGELDEGHKISVWRTRPVWCKGHLDTLDVDFDEHGEADVCIEDIKETFGGHSLKLKFLDEKGRYMFSRSIQISGPPRENGMVLKSPAEIEEEKQQIRETERLQRTERENKDDSNKMMMQLLTAVLSTKSESKQSDESVNSTMMQTMMSQIEAINKDRYNLMRETMGKTNPDPMTQLKSMLQMMETMKTALGSNEPTNQSDDLTKMVGGLFEVMKNSHGLSAPQNNLSAKQIEPRKVNVPTQNPSAAPVHPQFLRDAPPPVRNEENMKNTVASDRAPIDNGQDTDTTVTENVESDVVDQLSDMDPRELAEVVSVVLGTMPDDKQAQVFQEFEKLGQGGEPNE